MFTIPRYPHYVSASQPARAFMFTKVWFPRMWLRSDCFPDRTDAVVHYGMPSRRHCELLRAHAKKDGTPFRFVGDMDPLDLSVFASMQRGGAPPRARAAPAVPVVYAGINDDWLRFCERRLGHRPLTHVCIRQDATEQKLLRELVRAGMDIEALVGPRCAALLGDGLKLEIEGASNAALYGPDFMRVLLPCLLRNPGRQ